MDIGITTKTVNFNGREYIVRYFNGRILPVVKKVPTGSRNVYDLDVLAAVKALAAEAPFDA
jgi:hypothetical protein